MKNINTLIFTLALVSPIGFAQAAGVSSNSTAPGSTNSTTTSSPGTVDSNTGRMGTTTMPNTNPRATSPGRTTGTAAKNTGTTMGTNTLSSGTITSAQESLSNRGYDVRADGLDGVQTRRAVTRFQSENGIPQTGLLDEPTLNALSVTAEGTDRSPASTPTEY